MVPEVPCTQDAILDVVKAQRREIRRWASEDIGKVEDRRDRELRRLDQVAGIFDSGDIKPEVVNGSLTMQEPKPKVKRRRRRKNPTATMAALERREAIYRYMCEQARPVATGDIRRALKISDFSTKSALKRLGLEGRITSTGAGSMTRYEARADVPASSGLQPAHSSSEQGTAQGRILTMLEDRGWASLDELTQALHTPVEQVRKVCGALIREGEIRMTRRDGRPVYIRQRAA